jgi:hypothetical protein
MFLLSQEFILGERTGECPQSVDVSKKIEGEPPNMAEV